MDRSTRDDDDAGRPGARQLAGSVMRGLVRDHSFHYAAGTAFRTLLAIFPLLLGLISVATLMGSGEQIGNVLGEVGRTDAVPGRTIDALQSQLDNLDKPGPNHVIGAIIAFSLAIWSGAGAFRTTMCGLNRALDIDDRRGIVQRFFVSFGLAVVTASLAVAATLLIAEGPAVEHLFESLPGGSGPFKAVWELLKFPLAALLVFAWLAITYAWGPGDRRRFRLVTPGIVIAFLLWLAFALLFSAYVDSSGKQSDTYGAFAGLVAFQLYVYWSALIVLLGAQVDRALGSRGGTGGDAPSAAR
ncbi:MAG: ribonuclease [Thermoleophilia bacterium]|nr:ribonuclease [Thermoleophilia bacterium]